MLQDIHPNKFDNQFKKIEPKDTDFIMLFENDQLLMKLTDNSYSFTNIADIKTIDSNIISESIYLFSLNNTAFFCAFHPIKQNESLKYIKAIELREILPEWMTFAAATAGHLANWYTTNKFCGRCASKMSFNKNERSLHCKKCGLIRYPNINPAVIIGITDDEKILLTRYSDRPYKKLSLVAGYTEIGETLEDCIKREVMEEVGLSVKNIIYYKSQPWAFSQSLLMGFFAELDGSSVVTIDKRELSEANWYTRDEIPPCESSLSLTNEMIEVFRTQKRI